MTDNFENKVAVDGPVVNEGELGSSTFTTGQVSPAGPLGLGQRWTVTRKREVALRLLRGEPVELLSRQLGVEIFRLEQWREKAIAGIDASLKERKGDPVKAELDIAMKRIGELIMQVELLEAKTETSGWVFTAIEHWNAECVGWHVCKRGDRFAALQPISMGLARLYASTSAGAARGLALRMDHGSQYLSDHFTNQIKFWGIQPSYAFVEQPQTNGVAERFNRTLKEQIIHGRIYRNIAELRNAVRGFVEQYNAQWIVEKNGYLSPAQARQAWHTAMSLRPAA